MTKKRNKTESKRQKKNHTWKKNEVCLLFPNFKPTSNQTKIQIFFKIFYYKTYQKNQIILEIKDRKINNA